MQSIGGAAALLIELRKARLGFALRAFHLRDLRAERIPLLLDPRELRGLREDERHVLGLQAVLARFDLREKLEGMRFARLLDALRLLGGVHLRLCRAHRRGRLLRGGLRGRQRRARPRRFRFALRDGRVRPVDLGLPAVALRIRFLDAPLDLRRLSRDGVQLVAHAAAVLGKEADLLLEDRTSALAA